MKHAQPMPGRSKIAVTSTVAAMLLVPTVMFVAAFLAGLSVSRDVFVGLFAMVLPLAAFAGAGVSHFKGLSNWAAVAWCFSVTFALAIAVSYFIVS